MTDPHPRPARPEHLADGLRILLLWTWTAPLASAAFAGTGLAPAAAAFLALACTVYGFLAGRAAAGTGDVSRRRAAAVIALVAAGALAAAVATMGTETVAALREGAAFFAGQAAGTFAWHGLGALATWALATAGAAAAGRWPPSFDRAQDEVRLGLAGWVLVAVIVVLRGGPLPGETGRAILWVFAFVTAAIWTQAWHRSLEGWRESGHGSGASGVPAWFAAGMTGAVLAALAALALFLAPGALAAARDLLQPLAGLFDRLVYAVALPLGLLAEFLIRLARRLAGTPAQPRGLSEAPPGPARQLDHALSPYAPYLYAAVRTAVALLLLAGVAWLVYRVWLRLAEGRDARPEFVEVRGRLTARERPRKEPVAPPPSGPARRAFWRVKRCAARAGLPSETAAASLLARAARVAAAAGVEDVAVAAEHILSSYWPERYGRGGGPAADRVALSRSAGVLERGLREASRQGHTPKTGA